MMKEKIIKLNLKIKEDEKYFKENISFYYVSIF